MRVHANDGVFPHLVKEIATRQVRKFKDLAITGDLEPGEVAGFAVGGSSSTGTSSPLMRTEECSDDYNECSDDLHRDDCVKQHNAGNANSFHGC